MPLIAPENTGVAGSIFIPDLDKHTSAYARTQGFDGTPNILFWPRKDFLGLSAVSDLVCCFPCAEDRYLRK